MSTGYKHRGRRRERRRAQPPAPISPSAAPTASCWSLKIAPVSETLMCFMSQCLTVSHWCVGYCPISHFKWILCLGNHVPGPLHSNAEWCPVLQSRWLACACPGGRLHSQQIIPFWYLHASARRPDAKRVIGKREARSLPDKIHIDTCPAEGRKSEQGTWAVLRTDVSSWWSCPLHQKKTVACLQLLWCPAWPPVIGWIWSLFKNLVPFFT